MPSEVPPVSDTTVAPRGLNSQDSSSASWTANSRVGATSSTEGRAGPVPVFQCHGGGHLVGDHQTQGHGLAGTGLRRDAQVTASEVGIQDGGLDRRQFGEAASGENGAEARRDLREGDFMHLLFPVGFGRGRCHTETGVNRRAAGVKPSRNSAPGTGA